MRPMEIFKRIYRKGKRLFTNDEKRNVIKFKKEIWQTDEVSKSFVRGSDSAAIAAADIMDREVNEFFLTRCSVDNKVLDIGCGHGIVSEFLAKNGIQVSAVDISEKLLDAFRLRIQDKNLSIEIKQGDAYNIPYENEIFDVVVARMFLPHFPDWPIVLNEMSRVVKKGGEILVHFSSKENTELGKKIGSMECEFASSPDISNPWKFYAEADEPEIKKVAAYAGLEVMERTPVSFFLHNRIIGYQLGTKRYNAYMKEVEKYFSDEKIRDFVIWFDKEILAHSAPALSHFNIITFKKS
jgi:ubiquinone/menaquinone biosynthesis C-methylase UbiE